MASTDDQYWQRIGAEHPYWAVLSHEKYCGRELSPAHKEEFMASGASDVKFVLAAIRRFVNAEFAPRAALDFGCGVGRMLLPMAKHAAQATGVDVSGAMLERAAANAKEQGIEGLRFSETIPEERFDWINSYIVFQHIEPRKGVAILDTLLSRLTRAGAVSLHFSIFHDKRLMPAVVRDSRAGRFDGLNFAGFEREVPKEMPLYEYDLSEVMYHFVKNDFHTLALRHLDHGGLHGVWIFGAKE